MLVSLLFIVGKSVLTTKVLTDLLILLTSCSIACFFVKKFLSVIFCLLLAGYSDAPVRISIEYKE